MAREGLMDDCGYHGFDECARYEECCDEAYERGRADMLTDIKAKARKYHRGKGEPVEFVIYENELEELKEEK